MKNCDVSGLRLYIYIYIYRLKEGQAFTILHYNSYPNSRLQSASSVSLHTHDANRKANHSPAVGFSDVKKNYKKKKKNF